MTKILDLGCGRKKIAGAVGVDFKADTDADVIHDLNELPYPFNDNEFDLIICDNIIEHLSDTVKVMEEIYRITKPNGLIKIMVPFFSASDSFVDITHKRYFSVNSFNTFNPGNGLSYYSSARFEIIKRKINFGRLGKFLGIEFLANLFPDIYERHFAYIFPAFTIYFELKVMNEAD